MIRNDTQGDLTMSKLIAYDPFHDAALIDDQVVVAVTDQLNGAGEAGRTGPDYDDVVYWRFGHQ